MNVLTSIPFCGFLNSPNFERLSVAFASPKLVRKSGIFVFCHHCTFWPLAFGIAVTYWRNNVRVSVRPRRPLESRGALFRLFLIPNPKISRCIMSATFFLSRPGRCAGRVPLSRLIQKLARLGENAAIIALCDLPVSLSSRVRWTLYGTSLTVEVAA